MKTVLWFIWVGLISAGGMCIDVEFYGMGSGLLVFAIVGAIWHKGEFDSES